MTFFKNHYLRWFQYGVLVGITFGALVASYTFYFYVTKTDFSLDQLRLTDLKENEFKLVLKKGKPIVLNFLSRGCAPCINELPIFESAVNRYKDSIQFYFIMEEDTKGMQSFQKKYSYKLEYLLSQKSFKDYGILGVPQTYFIDKNYKIIDSQEGSFDSLGLEIKLNYLNRKKSK